MRVRAAQLCCLCTHACDVARCTRVATRIACVERMLLAVRSWAGVPTANPSTLIYDYLLKHAERRYSLRPPSTSPPAAIPPVLRGGPFRTRPATYKDPPDYELGEHQEQNPTHISF